MSNPWEKDWGMDGTTSAAPVVKSKPWEKNWGGQKPMKQSTTVQSSPSQQSDYYDILAQVESSGNPQAKASTSTATGLYQFTEGTWKSMVKQAGLDYSLDDRTDPKKSRTVVEKFTEKNRGYLEKRLDREVDNTELYLAHFLGRYGAGRFLEADPDVPATSVVSKSAAKNNKNVFFKRDGSPRTVAEVRQRYEAKFDEAPKREKGTGFLGELEVPGTDSIATEYSIGVEIDGKEVEIPTLVPNLTEAQKRKLLDSISKNEPPSEDIIQKATEHARKRMKEGKSPFAN